MGKEEEVMNAAQMIRDAFDANPDLRLVLEIATRAREVESKEPPQDLRASTEVVAIPSNSQCGV